MGNCTPSITISAAVRRLHPGLGNALVGAGLVLQANAETELVTADQLTPGRRGVIVVGYSDVPVLVTASAGEPASISFAAEDMTFAAALIAALARGTAPAVADPATRALMDMAARVCALAATLLLRASGSGAGLRWPTPAALARLYAAAWPGNVRELDNVLQRAQVLANGDRIEAHDLCFDHGGEVEAAVAPSLPGLVREHERDAIRAVLADCAGKRGEAPPRSGRVVHRCVR